MDHTILDIESPSNYLSLLYQWISIQYYLIDTYWISSIWFNNSRAYWISNKIRVSTDISYLNLYLSQRLLYVCDPLGPISSWSWVIPIRTHFSSMNYYLHNNSLNILTTNVLGHYATVPRRYKEIQSFCTLVFVG